MLSHMSDVLHPSPQYMPSSPVTNLAASFRRFQVLQQLFYTVEPRTPISSVMLHQCWPSSGIIVSFGQLAVLCLMHPKMCFAPWLPSTVLLTLSLLSLIPPCPSLLSCSAATYLPVCSLVWHCSHVQDPVYTLVEFHYPDDCPMLQIPLKSRKTASTTFLSSSKWMALS